VAVPTLTVAPAMGWLVSWSRMRPDTAADWEVGVGVGSAGVTVREGCGVFVGGGAGVKVGSTVGVDKAACTVTSGEVTRGETQPANKSAAVKSNDGHHTWTVVMLTIAIQAPSHLSLPCLCNTMGQLK
jgi:hypothetical protein